MGSPEGDEEAFSFTSFHGGDEEASLITGPEVGYQF